MVADERGDGEKLVEESERCRWVATRVKPNCRVSRKHPQYLRSQECVEPLYGGVVSDDSFHSIHIQHDLTQGWMNKTSLQVTSASLVSMVQRASASCKKVLQDLLLSHTHTHTHIYIYIYILTGSPVLHLGYHQNSGTQDSQFTETFSSFTVCAWIYIVYHYMSICDRLYV